MVGAAANRRETKETQMNDAAERDYYANVVVPALKDAGFYRVDADGNRID
jgi:hypothetical protein